MGRRNDFTQYIKIFFLTDNKTASELFTITDIPTDQKSVCGESNQSLTVTYGNHTNIKFRFEAEASEYTLTGIDLFSNVTDAEGMTFIDVFFILNA